MSLASVAICLKGNYEVMFLFDSLLALTTFLHATCPAINKCCSTEVENAVLSAQNCTYSKHRCPESESSWPHCPHANASVVLAAKSHGSIWSQEPEAHSGLWHSVP